MYMYKVDKTRVNEFGQGGDEDGDVVKGTEPVVKTDTPAKVLKESKKTK
jgi:hypothetical protein